MFHPILESWDQSESGEICAGGLRSVYKPEMWSWKWAAKFACWTCIGPFFGKNPNICIAFGIGCIFLFLIFTFCYCFGIVNPQNYKYWAVLSWYLVLYCYCMFASFCQKRFKWINYLLNHVKHLEKSCIFCMNVAYFREMLNI